MEKVCYYCFGDVGIDVYQNYCMACSPLAKQKPVKRIDYGNGDTVEKS